MYLDRRDYRGFVIGCAILAFCSAIVCLLMTRDLPAGVYFGRKYLLEPHIGDPAYIFPFWVSLFIGVTLATIACFRTFWER